MLRAHSLGAGIAIKKEFPLHRNLKMTGIPGREAAANSLISTLFLIRSFVVDLRAPGIPVREDAGGCPGHLLHRQKARDVPEVPTSPKDPRSQGQSRSELTRALCCGCSPCSHRSQSIDPMWNGSRAFFEAYVAVDRQRPDIILTPSHMHAQKCLCLLVSLRVSCEKL